MSVLGALSHFAIRQRPQGANARNSRHSINQTDDDLPPPQATSFATFLILCPTSFFLGILFSMFPYDYPLLWTAAPTAESYLPFLEAHLKHLHAAPALIPRILHIVIALGLIGFLTKLYKPSESNMLFDGASLVLYMIGVIIYITNIVKGLRVVSSGDYTQELVEGEGAIPGMMGAVEGDKPLGREDSLKVLAASNTILALVLVGVLVLQAGQWYAERKEGQEMAKMRRERRERHNDRGAKSPVGSGKKKA